MVERKTLCYPRGDGPASLRYGRLDRLSSCLILMACVITWARLDSIARRRPRVCAQSSRRHSPRSQRPLPAIYFLGYAQQPRSTFSVGAPESILHHARLQLHDDRSISSSHQATRHPFVFDIHRFHRQSHSYMVHVQSPKDKSWLGELRPLDSVRRRTSRSHETIHCKGTAR